MTQSQSKAIYAISKRLNVDAAYEVEQNFGWNLNDLTIKQASEVIDYLKSLQPNGVNGSNGNGGGR